MLGNWQGTLHASLFNAWLTSHVVGMHFPLCEYPICVVMACDWQLCLLLTISESFLTEYIEVHSVYSSL